MNVIGPDPVAILIDGENVSASNITRIVEEAKKHGQIALGRVYGNWASSGMVGWRKVLHENGLTPRAAFPYVTDKNSADGLLIIEAMDLLHTGKIKVFLIASSDSDFTNLALRIREESLLVIGFGEAKAPLSFQKACNIFIEAEPRKEVRSKARPVEVPLVPAGPEAKSMPSDNMSKYPSDLVETILSAYRNVVREDGTAPMTSLGSAIKKIDPQFDPKAYNKKQLNQLIKDMPETFDAIDKDSTSGIFYVKLKGPR